MADHVSLIHARRPAPARRRVEFRGSLVLAAIAVFELLNDAWWAAFAFTTGAVLLIPIAYIGGRSAARHPDWIEVRPDRITSLQSAGTGYALIRNPDSVLRVRNDRGQPTLRLDGTTSTGKILLARFDVDEIRRVTEASGWHWVAPDSTFPAPPTQVLAPPPSADETRIQVREGSTMRTRSSPQIVAPFIVCVAIAATVAAVAGVPPNAVFMMVAGAGFVLGLAMAAQSMKASNRLAISLSITPDRLSVDYGTLMSQVVQRTAVRSATIGRQYARLRSPDGRALVSIPLNPHRDAILDALADNGWPTTDGLVASSTQ